MDTTALFQAPRGQIQVHTRQQLQKPKPKPKQATATATAVAASAEPPISRSCRSTNNNTASKSNGNNNKSAFLSDRRFDNANVRARMSDATYEAMRSTFGYDRLSKVQALTFDALSSGRDVFAVSKTGSGKTLAFLLPLVDRAIAAAAATAASDASASSAHSSHSRRSFSRVYGVVVSPTKELASQTYEETTKLLTHLPSTTKLRAALVIGGNSRGADLKTLGSGNGSGGEVAVLVATPGRLEDHVENTPGFADEALAPHVRTVVLDEADRMMDAGFKKPLERILSTLRRPDRQTVMVTATLPPDVKTLASKYMKSDALMIDVAAATGQRDDDGQPRVNPAVHHAVLVAPHDLVHHAATDAVCDHAASRAEFKVIAFFPFKRQVQLMAELYRAVLPETCLGVDTQVLEIHSDLPQSQRDRASAAFRSSRRAVLLGTDVVARGVDYPDVTFVLQVGLTDRETYVHRVGRTGRAGRAGQALLVIAPFEESAMRKRLQGYGAEWTRAEDPGKSASQNASSRIRSNAPTARPVQIKRRPALDEAAAALARKQPGLFRRAFVAWLGFYGSEAKDMQVSKDRLEREAEAAYAALGLERPPEVSPEMRKKMGYPSSSR